jgi:hypothetical protein
LTASNTYGKEALVFHSELGSLQSRVDKARQSNDLYFAALLPKETIKEAFGEATGILDRARIYVTSVTVWVFLSQVLSIHHGCVTAVAKLIAYRVALGMTTCCAKTGAYCIARDKLDEQAMHRLLTHTGRDVEEQAPDAWLWLGHRVISADGTTVTMADTPENQASYPQQRSQSPGCGFPIMRMVVFFALATGTVLETAMGKYRGKLTHEVSLFREIDACIEQHDVFLADRAYAGWFDMARSSLLDNGEYRQEDIAALFRRRWQAELNLRSLKTVMQMEHLRCKKPHRVRNEVRAHMIAYNLIRQVMSEAACAAGVEPWRISFKATMTTLTEMLPVLGMIRDPADLCCGLWACCQQHVVGDRPDRYEPRVGWRRPKSYKLVQKPRHDYKPGEA